MSPDESAVRAGCGLHVQPDSTQRSWGTLSNHLYLPQGRLVLCQEKLNCPEGADTSNKTPVTASHQIILCERQQHHAKSMCQPALVTGKEMLTQVCYMPSRAVGYDCVAVHQLRPTPTYSQECRKPGIEVWAGFGWQECRPCCRLLLAGSNDDWWKLILQGIPAVDHCKWCWQTLQDCVCYFSKPLGLSLFALYAQA